MHRPVKQGLDNDSTQEAQVPQENGRGLVTLTAFALGIAVGLLVRMSQRTHERKDLRDNAYATLRESGEHFFGAQEDEPARQPILDS